MVRVQKSARRLELSAPAYSLTFDADRPWVVALAAGTGAPALDFFLGAGVDTAAGRDELAPPGTPELTREDETLVATYTSASSRWAAKRYVFACTEADIAYRVEVEGRGVITACRFGQGALARDLEALGLGPNYFRAGYQRPYRDLARGSRAHALSVFTARPTAAERDLLPLWEDSEIDLRDDPLRHGGGDSFLPAPWMFALDLGRDQPWAAVGLAARPEELDFTRFALRGGETVGFELAYDGRPVDGAWRSPELVFTLGARDHYAALRSLAEALRRRDLLPDSPLAQPACWRAPVFDGQGEQCTLAGRGDPAGECTAANYFDALAILAQHGLAPGAVWLGEGWMGDAPGRPDTARWPDFRGFVARQHQAGRQVVVSWPLGLAPPPGVPRDPRQPAWRGWLGELLTPLLSPDGLDLDGVRIADQGWPDAAWLYHALAALRAIAKEAKPEALIVAPTINSAYAALVDLAPTGSLWTDRRSVAAAVRHRAAVARIAGPRWLIGVSDRHAPGREAWREVIELQPSLGVPILSYARGLDQTGEPLEAEDFALVARAWQEAAS
jgi:hypothetical protein